MKILNNAVISKCGTSVEVKYKMRFTKWSPLKMKDRLRVGVNKEAGDELL